MPLGPVGKVYGDVAEARKKNFTFKVKKMGKGLTLFPTTYITYNLTLQCYVYQHLARTQ